MNIDKFRETMKAIVSGDKAGFYDRWHAHYIEAKNHCLTSYAETHRGEETVTEIGCFDPNKGLILYDGWHYHYEGPDIEEAVYFILNPTEYGTIEEKFPD